MLVFPLYSETMKNAFLKIGKYFLVSTLLLLFAAIPESHARNLAKRLGAGFVSQIATTEDGRLPAIDAKYYFSKRVAGSLGVGFDTRETNSAFGVGTKFFYNLFGEQNLLFYTGLGIAVLSRSGTRMQVSGFFGTEFFLTDLPSLGFSVEAGIRGDSSRGKFSLRTTGDSFLTAGIHFYF